MAAQLRPRNALGRHLALAGFMGAGKTTIGAMVAVRIGRLFLDLDREIERSLQRSIPELVPHRGPLLALDSHHVTPLP